MIAILSLVKIAYADGPNCERYVGEADVGGATIYKDTGVCNPDYCPGLDDCEEIAFPGIPMSYICNCGMSGNACTIKFTGPSGGTGTVSCYNNSCTNPCGAPAQKEIPEGGYETFTWMGNVYYVLTCPCPE
jgi:hypothetical protein